MNLNALVYFLKEDLDPKSGTLLPGTPVEPLILRANAGDCLNITLENRVPTVDLNVGSSSLGIPINTSHEVGLHAQLVSFDVTSSNGVNVGKNPSVTITPGNSGGYTWYTGNIEVDAAANVQHIPVEFGSIPLTPSDPLMQHPFGLVGALVIEPIGTSWRTDDNARASASVCSGTSGCNAGNLLFREFVVVVQDDVSSVRQTTGTPGETESTLIPYSRALNYRTEPLDYRLVDPAWLENLNVNAPLGVSQALSNSVVLADPQTPVFVAIANTPLRFRMVHPAGINEQVFTLHGHVWQEEPYVNGSKEIGHNPLSQSQGSRDGFGANVSFDAVIDKAGGAGGVPGDYLFRTFIGNVFLNGMWGLLRVTAPKQDVVTITRFSSPKATRGRVLIAGTTTVDPNTGRMADRVTIFDTTKGGKRELGQAEVDKLTGIWPKNGQPFSAPGTVTSIMVLSAGNGQTVAASYIREPPAVPSAAAARAVAAKKRPTTQRTDELELFNATPKRTETFLQAAGQESSQSEWLLNGRSLGADRTVVVRPGDTITIAVKEGRHESRHSSMPRWRRASSSSGCPGSLSNRTARPHRPALSKVLVSSPRSRCARIFLPRRRACHSRAPSTDSEWTRRSSSNGEAGSARQVSHARPRESIDLDRDEIRASGGRRGPLVRIRRSCIVTAHLQCRPTARTDDSHRVRGHLVRNPHEREDRHPCDREPNRAGGHDHRLRGDTARAGTTQQSRRARRRQRRHRVHDS